jgi:hypothetical protein
MNYFLVMYCLGLTDNNAIARQYDSLPDQVKNYCSQRIQEIHNSKEKKTISHQAIIEMIKAVG